MTRPHALALVVGLLTAIGPTQDEPVSARQRDRTDQPAPSSPAPGQGATTTRLADGRWLLTGGQGIDGPLPTAWVFDPATRRTTALPQPMQQPRVGHSATLLADGTVLLIGGRNGGALVEVPEVFNPATGAFNPLAVSGAVRRAGHSATLLTTGQVLVAGGDNGGATAVPTEVWDIAAQTATALGASPLNRRGHSATLTADGQVLIAGGAGLDGRDGSQPVLLHPVRGTVQSAPDLRGEREPAPEVVASVPSASATDVSLEAHVTLRFSTAMAPDSLSAETVQLSGPDGPVVTQVIPAEGGRLAFVWPASPLAEDATYTLRVSGAVDGRGVAVAPTVLRLRTVRRPLTAASDDDEAWTPDRRPGARNGWRTNRPPSPWESLRPLTAPPGASAVSGRVLRLDGRPLADVTLRLGGQTTRSDSSGRFLLRVDGLATGEHTLVIDARTANQRQRTYGYYEARIGAYAGQTTVLPFTIWSPALDTVHAVTIPSPTTAETVITTPTMPGLELHLPAGTVIRGEDHQVARTVSLTPIPLDRTPFPLPVDATFTMFFTIQPGGAYLSTPGPIKGGWLVYPNAGESRVGKRVQFFNYDPDDKGWYPYGMGTVTRTQVVPDPTARIYGFTGASYDDGAAPPEGGKNPEGPEDGDPVDPSTGAFIMTKTDLAIPDVLPLTLTRTYNSQDPEQRAFGFGMTHNYGFIQHSEDFPAEADVYLPDGGRLHFERVSDPALSWFFTVFEHTATPTAFYKARLSFWGSAIGLGGWLVTRTDGTLYIFGHGAPLQAIRDRYGNETRFTWSDVNFFGSGTGNLLRVTSPNGRWIAFTYDGSDRVTQVTDHIGRTVAYTYDGSGNLETVTDAENHVTTYTYDGSHRLLTITDGRDITYLTNTYASGRVATQALADAEAVYAFDYTVDGAGDITQTDVTNPRGFVKRYAFNADHYPTSVTEAFGTGLARTTTFERESGTNLLEATVDELDRRTEYTYDDHGHVLAATRLAGTGDAVTTTFTYEPQFGQVTSVTDPLSHTWSVTYNASGVPTAVSDPLSHQTTITTNTAGQVTMVTDALSHGWQAGYTLGDLTSTTNPLGAVHARLTDPVGRTIAATDPLGRVTRTSYDDLNRVTAVTDPAGGETSFTYDENSNLLSLTDARSHSTSYTYDDFDRVATRTDPLSQSQSYEYDFHDNLTETTDRESQVTGSTYDALDRLTQITFDDSSTIAYTYDVGDRLTQIVDSTNGTITREYDDLDRLIEETTPQGTIAYTYDDDGRRATMTVTGQTSVSYTYDNAHRLTAITRGAATVAITYDNADRRSTLTYPNGIVATYGYDNANQLIGLAYTLDSKPVGDVTYVYDLAGNRTSVGGAWARTGLPAALGSATYDAANRLTAWDATDFTYDLNGNLTGDETNTYTWNARNQLASLSGGVSASFAYDGMGRRRGKTIGGTTTNFLYDGLNFVQELNGGGAPIANLLTGLGIDETFTRADGSGTSTLLVDALGSTLALASSAGSVQTTYTFEPFGSTTSSGSSNSNSAQFTGRENDGDGLYHYRGRYYHAGIHRFLSEDPIDFAAGDVNLYAYVFNNPVNLVDPTGLAAGRVCRWIQGLRRVRNVWVQALVIVCTVALDGPKPIRPLDLPKPAPKSAPKDPGKHPGDVPLLPPPADIPLPPEPADIPLPPDENKPCGERKCEPKNPDHPENS